MHSVIIIHGSPDREEYYDPNTPSPSNNHWFPWIQKQLGLADVVCQTPEMPRPYNLDYDEYCRVLQQYCIDSGTVLVGHSSGAGFLLRFLSENTTLAPGRVILVAPGIDAEREYSTGLSDFVMDANLSSRTDIHVIYSLDDFDSILDCVELIRTQLPQATMHEFAGKGHFTESDIGKEFPELLDLILKS